MPKRDRGYYRKQRIKSIKKRRKLIKDQKYAGAYRGKWIDEPEFESGILAKGHNGWLGRAGTAEKTNTRKGHTSKLKKSHKGCCVVQRDYYDNDLYCIDGLEGIRQNSELKTVFKDGRIIHRDTFEEIRNRLNGEI